MWMFTCLLVPVFVGQENKQMVNLLSLRQGTLPVIVPESYRSWPAQALLDDNPKSGWSSEFGQVKDHVFVFEMISPAVIELFELDNSAVDREGAGAKDITVEASSQSRDSGFQTVLRATLADRADYQHFVPAKLISARWIRLTIHSNHGSKIWTELLSFNGFGVKPESSPPAANITGTYGSDCTRFYLWQQGKIVVGCYEYNKGLIDGDIEGRILNLNWREGENTGPGVIIFSKGGKSFRGFWWNEGRANAAPLECWDGKKVHPRIGRHSPLVGPIGGEVKKGGNSEDWPRFYSIHFQLNSAVIQPENKPILREVVNMLNSNLQFTLTIGGYADASGTRNYNRILSERRSEAVKAYLIARGIDGNRMRIRAFGSTRPVADNFTEQGRAMNRRVEVIRQ